MTLQQGKIYKYRDELHRVVSLHEFGGETWAVCERIGRWHGMFVDTLRVTVEASEVEASEWIVAMRRAEAERRAQAKKAQAKADAERFGVAVVVTCASMPDRLVTIVRATPTGYTDSKGTRYNRRTGMRIASGYGPWPTITPEGLATLAEFCGDRAKVDIVAERRKSAEQHEREIGGASC